MKLFKLTVILSAFVLISTVAWAGNTPEYDAVGTDFHNFYSLFTVNYAVVNFGPNYELEKYSNFPWRWNGDYYWGEDFKTNAGQLQESPCFSRENCGEDIVKSERFIRPPLAALTDVWNEGTYEWWIVLQMKPESDINLNIYDCVLKHNETDLYRFADQTGRYRMPWGDLMFNAAWSPLVSASAVPGPFATTAFAQFYAASGDEMILDARTLPGLVSIPLDGASYTSKAHWSEGIVLAAPKSGVTNGSGQMEYNLKQGDMIHVTVEIPPDTNTVDVWYGPDSVTLKYIGIINTEFFAQL
jgi:hypothetical protein